MQFGESDHYAAGAGGAGNHTLRTVTPLLHAATIELPRCGKALPRSPYLKQSREAAHYR